MLIGLVHYTMAVTRRTKEHELETASRDQLTALFHRKGWTVESIRSDYGEDLLVRVFVAGQATPWIFFVQIKAFSDVAKSRVYGGKYLSVPVDPEHLSAWAVLREPVVLAAWDAVTKLVYWQTIQTAVDVASRRSEFAKSRRPTTRLHVPAENILDDAGADRLALRARAAWERLDREREGAQELLAALREQLGLEVTYDPQYGTLIIPAGKFVPAVGQRPKVHCFGRAARDIHEIATRLGVSPQNAFEQVMTVQLAFLKRVANGKAVSFRTRSGRVVKEWHSVQDVSEEIFRMYEQSDED
jgi:hypothetical protein